MFVFVLMLMLMLLYYIRNRIVPGVDKGRA
jgi:hypothetical protein